MADLNSTHSAFRERAVEHIFIGDVLRHFWQLRMADVEILRSEFDAGGYDLVISHGNITRFIQLKSSVEDGRTAYVNASLKLLEKPSGCIIWLIINKSDLSIKKYLWFGGSPGAPLPDIRKMKIAKHTKGNAQGIKTERTLHRQIPKKQFESLDNMTQILQKLFGTEISAG